MKNLDSDIHLIAKALVLHSLNNSCIGVIYDVRNKMHSLVSIINWFAKWNFTCKPIPTMWTSAIKSYQCGAKMMKLCYQYFLDEDLFL